MSEPTSALSYPDLAAKVGSFLGYGLGAQFGDTLWTAARAYLVDDCVRSGCRKVYSPMPPYDWSFLHPFSSVELAPGKSAVQLPDDCAGIEGKIVVTTTGSTAQSSWLPGLRLTNPELIKVRFAESPSTTGAPLCAAITQLKGTSQYAGQKEQLLIFPRADVSYTLTFQYYVVPDSPAPPPPSGGSPGAANNPNFPGVVTGNPYVYGGAVHAETFLEACLAVAEQRLDDMSGLHTQLLQERLAASMAVDRRSKEQFVGRNRDCSDGATGRGRWWEQFPPAATYNGASYD